MQRMYRGKWMLYLALSLLLAACGSPTGNNNPCSTASNTPGSLDTCFDTDGKVTTQIGPSVDDANALVIQPDGKIVAGGRSLLGNYAFALVRYNP